MDARRSASASTPLSAAAPADTVVYAVGDVHGRLDLLQPLTAEIAARAARGEPVTAVFLGDYIDRGPQSREVIDHLIALEATVAFKTVFLRGNHEQFLLDLVDGEADGTTWLDYGGLETLKSYGVDPARTELRDPVRLGLAVREALPDGHLAFLRATRLKVEMGDYLFVHAGLRPDRLLAEQSDADLLWFRYYSDEPPAHGKVVVHGHTPRERPVAGRWRIGIDTGAFATGALTAVRLSGSERDFLKVALTQGAPVSVGDWDDVDRPHDRPDVSAARDARGRRAFANQKSSRRGVMVVAAMAATLFLVALAGLAWRHASTLPAHPPSVAAAGG